MASKVLIALLLTVCACHVIQGRQLIGSKSCTWGPSYWCQSFQTATECGANYHCMKHVWSQNPHGFCSGVLCDTCEEIVGSLLNKSMSNIKAELKNAMEQFCREEAKILRGVCKHIVTHDLMPYLNKYLKTLTAKKVCTLLNACSATKLTLDDIKGVLAPGIVENIPKHPKIKDILAPGVARNRRPLKELDDILAPGAARDVESNGVIGSQLNVNEDRLSCITCSIAVAKIDAALRNANTEGKIVVDVDRMCQYLPDKLSNECQSYVNKFGPSILQALLQYLPAKQICASYIHACPESTLDNDVQVAVAPTQLASSSCVICELAVQVAEKYLQINKTEDMLLQDLKVLCDTKVPAGPSRQNCLKDVNVVKFFFHKINKGISPSNVCETVGLCKKSEMAPKQMDVCRLGPTFWCSTKNTAAICKKSKYCGFQ